MTDKIHRTSVRRYGTEPPPPDWADTFYLQELQIQCSFAERSYGEIQSRVSKGEKDSNLWAFIHMLLVFSGNAAKLIFPSSGAPPTAHERAKRLRDTLKTHVPPAGLISARNYFEHFDERIDQYLANTKGMLIYSLITEKVTDKMTVDDGRRFRPKYLKLFETSTFDLKIYNRTINLHELIKEVLSLQEKVEVALSELSAKETKL